MAAGTKCWPCLVELAVREGPKGGYTWLPIWHKGATHSDYDRMSSASTQSFKKVSGNRNALSLLPQGGDF